jgi:hypothetical protein
MFNRNPFLKGVMMIGIGLFLLWQCVQSLNVDRRLDTNPHVRATVERTWVTNGKNRSRYADVSFAGPIGIGLCHAKTVRLGSGAIDARSGQVIDLVPIPGSCDNPDAPSARQSGLAWAIELGGAFLAFLFGVMAMFGFVRAGDQPFGPVRMFR